MVLDALFSGGRRAEERRLAHALRSVPLFRDLPGDDLVAIWRHLREVRLTVGTVICRRGDPGDQFFVVQSGLVEVRLGLGPSGMVLRHVAPGDFVGEMALLTGAPRSADLVAADDCVLWSLARDDFDALLNSSMSLLRGFTRALCERLAEMTRRLEERGASGGVEGMRFGSYTTVEQLGAGGMAAVYSALHDTTDTAVALKVLPAAWGHAPDLRARLGREAAALRSLDHPNVVRVLEVGEVDPQLGGGTYMAMEWLPHGLDRILWARYPEPLPAATALSVAEGVARGLAAVHEAGLVHRDVKPSNIMLRVDGTPVLTDFGLVGMLADAAAAERLTPADIFMGTADYVAPEVIGGAPAGPPSDLYSLGVVLYEMLSGSVPFAGRPPMEALRAHVEEEPPPLPDEVPPAAAAIVGRTLQKDPTARFASAAALADELAVARALVQGNPSPA